METKTSEASPTLQEWFLSNLPDPGQRFFADYEQQVMFVRDSLVRLIAADLHWSERDHVATVISTHRSKSITLPVYALTRPGLRLVMRNNFHSWKLSVISDTPIVSDFTGLFHTTPPVDPAYTGDPLASVYFGGFPENLVFDYYGVSDKLRWSAEIHSDHALWMTVFLISRWCGYVRPMEWATSQARKDG